MSEMPKPYSINEMIELIDQYIKFEMDHERFDKTFSDIVLNYSPDSTVTERDEIFIEAIRERLEWTTEHLHEGEIADGYIDWNGFREWLNHQYERYKNRPDIDKFPIW
jgi:hypothetical protein